MIHFRLSSSKMTYFRVISVKRFFIKDLTEGPIKGMVTGVYRMRHVRDEGVSKKWSEGWLGPSVRLRGGIEKMHLLKLSFSGDGLRFLVTSLGGRHYYDM